MIYIIVIKNEYKGKYKLKKDSLTGVGCKIIRIFGFLSRSSHPLSFFIYMCNQFARENISEQIVNQFFLEGLLWFR